jgi:hypothetical protein
MSKTATALMAALALAGCASGPSAEEVRHADYGVFPSAYRDAVKAYYGRVLKDPDSVTYRSFGDPGTFWYSDRFNKPRYGYLTCVTYNAKNSYGGYVGYKTDGVFFRDGEIVDVFEGGVRFGKAVC